MSIKRLAAIFSLLCPLAIFAVPADSDWVYYAKSSKSGFEIYYSKSSIKNEGTLTTVKILKNFKNPQEFTAEQPYFKFLSSVETQVINCDKKIYRGSRTEKWTEQWGMGALGKAYDYSQKKKNDWSEPVKSAQIEGSLIDKVCH